MIDKPPSVWRFVGLATLVLVVAGCDVNPAVPGGAGGGPFGPPEKRRLLAPFSGAWRFDAETTLEEQEAAGIGDEQIAQQRKFMRTTRNSRRCST